MAQFSHCNALVGVLKAGNSPLKTQLPNARPTTGFKVARRCEHEEKTAALLQRECCWGRGRSPLMWGGGKLHYSCGAPFRKSSFIRTLQCSAMGVLVRLVCHFFFLFLFVVAFSIGFHSACVQSACLCVRVHLALLFTLTLPDCTLRGH